MIDPPDPARTYAVVVGIETYATGAAWNLDGAAGDALGVARWLRAAGVPAARIALVVAPLEPNRGAVATQATDLGIQARMSARRDDILTLLRDELAGADGDHLVLYWSGHGVLDDADNRALYTSDATTNDPRNILVDDLLVFLKDKTVKNLHLQFLLVDACANFFEGLKSTAALPHTDFPKTVRRSGVEQFVLFSAAQGQIAKPRSGHFTEVVLAELNGAAGVQWPPDAKALATCAEAHFAAQREQGFSHQAPVYFWWRDRAGNEEATGVRPVSGRTQRAGLGAGLTVSQVQALVTALAGAPMLRHEAGRTRLLDELGAAAEVSPQADFAASLEAIVNWVLERGILDRLGAALLTVAATEDDRGAVEQVRRQVGLQQLIAAPLALFGVVKASALASYYDVVPDRQLAPRLHELDDVLSYLAEFGDHPDRPLLRFVARLEHLVGSPMSDDWFGLGAAALAKLRSDERAAIESRLRLHLVLDLRSPGSGSCVWPNEVIGHLRGGDGKWDKKTMAELSSETDIRAAIADLITWAYDVSQDGQDGRSLAIGFWLPRARYDDTPEAWTYGDEMSASPIRDEHLAVLHCGERSRNAKPLALWRTEVDRIAVAVDVGAPDIVWIERADALDALAVRRRVQAARAACVGFGFVPGPLLGDLASDPLIAAIAAGAPYLVWFDAEPDDWDEARRIVGELVAFGEFGELPTRLLELRRSPGARVDATTVRLLWDAPELLPGIGRLGGMRERTA